MDEKASNNPACWPDMVLQMDVANTGLKTLKSNCTSCPYNYTSNYVLDHRLFVFNICSWKIFYEINFCLQPYVTTVVAYRA